MSFLLLSIIIPVIACIVFHVWFRCRVVWWEVPLLFAPSVVMIPMFWLIGQYSQTLDYERLGGICQMVEKVEEWNERVTCRHDVYEDRRTGTDKDGRAIYTRVYVGKEHSYDVDYHPETRTAYGSNGERVSLSVDQYAWAARKFGNEKFVDMHRSYHTIDGDKYIATWDHNDESFIPVFTTGRYQNRVLVNTGLYQFNKLDEKDIKRVYEEPSIASPFHDPAILGPNPQSEADRIAQKFNAINGKRLQVRTWYMLFRNETREVAKLQEAHWIGFNKNEFVVCIGIDDNQNVQWCDTFCWSPDGYAGNNEVKINVRNYTETMGKLDMVSVVNFTNGELNKLWKRKPFEELEFLDIPTPLWAIILNFVLTTVACGAVGYCVYGNEHVQDGSYFRGNHGRGSRGRSYYGKRSY